MVGDAARGFPAISASALRALRRATPQSSFG